MPLFALLSEGNTARDDDKNESKNHGGDKGHEPVVVVGANTVINPRAMVIKALNTPIANSTML